MLSLAYLFAFIPGHFQIISYILVSGKLNKAYLQAKLNVYKTGDFYQNM